MEITYQNIRRNTADRWVYFSFGRNGLLGISDRGLLGHRSHKRRRCDDRLHPADPNAGRLLAPTGDQDR